MEGQTEIANIERKLSELADIIKSLPQEQRRSSRSTKQLDWAERILQCFNQFKAGIEAIKQQLNTSANSCPSEKSDLTTNITTTTDAITQSNASQNQLQLPLSTTSQQTVIKVPLAYPTTTPPDETVTPMFDCDITDISTKLNEPKFSRFSSDSFAKIYGYFKLKVHNLPPLRVEQSSVSQPGEDHCTTFSSRVDHPGFVRVSKGPDRKVVFPSFPLPETPEQSWSQSARKKLWEETFKHPLQDMQYVIGAPLFPDIELDPGHWLKQRDNIPGVNTTYSYLACGKTFTSMHEENVRLPSLNLLRSGGYKFWLVVKPADREKLECCMRREFQMATCSQALHHLSYLISPTKLDEWEISYSLPYTKPGEALVTLPGALHQVLNGSTNYAISINFSHSSSFTIPRDYIFCTDKCDPHAITEAHLQVREQQPLAEAHGNKVARQSRQKLAVQPLARTQSNAIPNEIQSCDPVPPKTAGTKRKLPLYERPPKSRKVTPEIESLLKAVCGKGASLRVCALIHSWRDPSESLFKADKDITAVHLVQTIERLKTQLDGFLCRFLQVKLAEIIDNGKSDRTRADSGVIDNLMEKLQWDKTKRHKLHYHLREGRQWKKIVGDFNGLLCLMPSSLLDQQGTEDLRISGRMYQDLSDEDIRAFHILLESNEFIQPMCQMGRTFQESIWTNKEVPLFRWESVDHKIERLSLAQLTPLMEEFTIITDYKWDEGKYDWPKPDDWPWRWPMNPSEIPPSETTLCDLCNECSREKICDCIKRCMPNNEPCITNEGDKGLGLRVIGEAYQVGQIIGLFLGEFAPLGTYQNSWALEFRRPDVSDEPIAQIYSEVMGSKFKLLNHSCNPSAKFCEQKISGRWWSTIVAINYIPHNGEITVYCGKNFLVECLCSDCV